MLIVPAVIAWSLSGMPDDHGDGYDSGRFVATMKLAESQNPPAEYRLAQMYALGVGVEKNKPVAWIWLERAAQHGNVQAQYELGLALLNGDGVVQDFERSAEWLQKAAASGHAKAQFELAGMYSRGTGVAVDRVKSYLWMNLAAAGGIEQAASARDVVVRVLSPAQIAEAQAEARRLAEAWSPTRSK